jgi:hypothetical protein
MAPFPSVGILGVVKTPGRESLLPDGHFQLVHLHPLLLQSLPQVLQLTLQQFFRNPRIDDEMGR